MMTKKDFEKIATVIRKNYERINKHKRIKSKEILVRKNTLDLLLDDLISIFEDINPRFERYKFIAKTAIIIDKEEKKYGDEYE